jgi:hypothetical protein
MGQPVAAPILFGEQSLVIRRGVLAASALYFASPSLPYRLYSTLVISDFFASSGLPFLKATLL